jgi:hypothetical protein
MSRISQGRHQLPSLGTRSIPVDAPAALARLKEEGCIYTRKDEFGWKIGLKVNFVERLKYC